LNPNICEYEGIDLMTIHKSKGKEFDGVILVHIGNNISPPMTAASEQDAESKRLPGETMMSIRKMLIFMLRSMRALYKFSRQDKTLFGNRGRKKRNTGFSRGGKTRRGEQY